MRQPRLTEAEAPRDLSRLLISMAIAALLHLSLFIWLHNYETDAISVDFESISVEIVTLATLSPPAAAPELSPEIKPPAETKPEPIIEPQLKPTPTPLPEVILTPPPPTPTPAPDILPPEGQSSLPIQAAPTPQGDTLIPDRWRLPVGSRISLDKIGPPKGTLQQALDCLKGFNANCAEQRKTVFADDQLSETDLVWMASHPHSGLSDSSLFGLSEAEIRQRLAIPTAGENGFAILPGIAIDGPLWDLLHGVNKGCDYSVGIGESGQRELRKSCKDGKRPSSKDRIAFKPLEE